MATELYDDAYVKKLKAWTQNTNVRVLTADSTKRLYEVLADEGDDKPIELPLITLRRTGGYKVLIPRRQTLSYDGETYKATPERSLQLNVIPIQLDYQIDVYTRKFQEADEYMRNILFNLINFPQISVTMMYNGEEIVFDSAITVSDQVDDTSEIPERMIQGQFTRLTLNTSIEDAYLWDFRVRDNYTIVGDSVQPLERQMEGRIQIDRIVAGELDDAAFVI